MVNSLGLLIYTEKSLLFLAQRIEFIGAILDSSQARAFHLEYRFQAIFSIVVILKAHSVTTTQNSLRLLGNMASCTYMLQYTRQGLRTLQGSQSSVNLPCNHQLDSCVRVPFLVLTSLDWWTNPANIHVGVPFACPQLTLRLVTDAAALGWVAHLGFQQVQGLWSSKDLALHIRVRELNTLRLVCQVFLSQIRGSSLLVLTDNTATMFYLNKQGEPCFSPLCQEVTTLGAPIASSIDLEASYLPSRE